ncbi:MAG: type III pantothenate kinase [Geminicoccaceae bacterium]
MLLAVDVGNTNTVFALYRDQTKLGQWRISTVRERTSDEYAAALMQLIHLAGFDYQEISNTIISSVVPQAILPLRWICRDYLDCPALVIGDDIGVPIDIELENPREVGSDRLVNAFAAHNRYGGPLIIVDFGTATTFDVVGPEGSYQGGAIAPGINLSLEALHRAAAKLPRIAVDKPQAVVGRSTVSAMQSGIFWGYVGLIEGIVSRIRAETGQSMKTIGTGGLANLFAGSTDAIEYVDKDLTMVGMVDIFHARRASPPPKDPG